MEGDHWGEVNKMRMGQYLMKTEDEFVQKRPFNGLCLDIGSGSRNKPVQAKWISIDINRVSLCQNGSEYAILADALHLPFKDGTFNSILAIQVADHLLLDAFMREIWRVSRAGCKIVLTIANKRSWKGVLFPLAKRANLVSAKTKFYARNWQESRQIILESGFSIEDARGYSWIPFNRDSNSEFIGTAARIEKLMRLDRLVFCSPWVLVFFTKPRS